LLLNTLLARLTIDLTIIDCCYVFNVYLSLSYDCLIYTKNYDCLIYTKISNSNFNGRLLLDDVYGYCYFC